MKGGDIKGSIFDSTRNMEWLYYLHLQRYDDFVEGLLSHIIASPESRSILLMSVGAMFATSCATLLEQSVATRAHDHEMPHLYQGPVKDFDFQKLLDISIFFSLPSILAVFDKLHGISRSLKGRHNRGRDPQYFSA